MSGQWACQPAAPMPHGACHSSARPPSCLTVLLQLEQRELLGRHRDKYDHILREVVARYGTGKLAHPTSPGALMRDVLAQPARVHACWSGGPHVPCYFAFKLTHT